MAVDADGVWRTLKFARELACLQIQAMNMGDYFVRRTVNTHRRGDGGTIQEKDHVQGCRFGSGRRRKDHSGSANAKLGEKHVSLRCSRKG